MKKYYIHLNLLMGFVLLLLVGSQLRSVLKSVDSQTTVQAAETNLLSNPGFEGLGGVYPWYYPWQLITNNGGASAMDRDFSTFMGTAPALKIGITTPGSTVKSIQIVQAQIPTQPSTSYTISFWAKAAVNRPLDVILSDGTGFGAIETNHQTFSLTTDWQQFNFIHVTDGTSSSASALSFAAGAFAGNVWVDSVFFGTTSVATPTPTPTDTPTPTPTNTPTPTPTPDTEFPSVVITSPANGSRVKRNSTVTIQASASDNVGVTQVTFHINGVEKCADTLAPYTCAWLVPSPNNVTYALTAKAYDAAGNITTSAPVSVKSRN